MKIPRKNPSSLLPNGAPHDHARRINLLYRLQPPGLELHPLHSGMAAQVSISPAFCLNRNLSLDWALSSTYFLLGPGKFTYASPLARCLHSHELSGAALCLDLSP